MAAERLLRDWYEGARWLHLLRPLAWLFRTIVRRRRRQYLGQKEQLWQSPAPIIIVGNITLGGTGKSPLVATLVRQLREMGWRPGIISRGYGGRAPQYPMLVTPESDPDESGDEPLMLARQCGCPVVVDPLRVNAARHLLEQTDCNLILSDDGLQHYALRRDLEIVVLDGRRGLGNGWCLPAGPLREPPERLGSVDLIVTNGKLERSLPTFNGAASAKGEGSGFPATWEMHLQPTMLVRLIDGQELSVEAMAGQTVHAVAGIGNPDRFFRTLESLGLRVIPHAFADHHRYNRQDLAYDDDLPILMTEKDAVKWREFANERMYALRVEARLAPGFFQRLESLLATVRPEH